MLKTTFTSQLFHFCPSTPFVFVVMLYDWYCLKTFLKRTYHCLLQDLVRSTVAMISAHLPQNHILQVPYVPCSYPAWVYMGHTSNSIVFSWPRWFPTLSGLHTSCHMTRRDALITHFSCTPLKIITSGRSPSLVLRQLAWHGLGSMVNPLYPPNQLLRDPTCPSLTPEIAHKLFRKVLGDQSDSATDYQNTLALRSQSMISSINHKGKAARERI